MVAKTCGSKSNCYSDQDVAIGSIPVELNHPVQGEITAGVIVEHPGEVAASDDNTVS